MNNIFDLLKETEISEEQAGFNTEAKSYIEDVVYKRRGKVMEIIDSPSVTTFRVGFTGNEDKWPQIYASGKPASIAIGQLVTHFDIRDAQPIIKHSGNRLNIDIPKNTGCKTVFTAKEGFLGIEDKKKEMEFPFYAGRTNEGEHIYFDINNSETRALLISGQNGSGKTVFGRMLLLNSLMCYTTNEFQSIIFDYKGTEFSHFKNVPGVVEYYDEKSEYFNYVEKISAEINRRNSLLKESGVEKIDNYNKEVSDDNKIPHLLVFMDEYQSIIELPTIGKKINKELENIARTGRSVGVHLIVMTQRPTAATLGSILRGELNGRVCFKVDNSSAANMALGIHGSGAEYLLGNGDGMFKTSGDTAKRFQSPYIELNEVRNICNYLKNR